MHNFFISLTSGGADRHHVTQGFAKKNPASMWPGKANNQVGGKQVTMKRQWQTSSKHNNRHMHVTHRHRTMSNKVLPKNKHESQALVTRRGESPPGPGVCFCACAHVCVTMKKVPDEWRARQATPVILQVSSTYHHRIADITSRNHHPV